MSCSGPVAQTAGTTGPGRLDRVAHIDACSVLQRPTAVTEAGGGTVLSFTVFIHAICPLVFRAGPFNAGAYVHLGRVARKTKFKAGSRIGF